MPVNLSLFAARCLLPFPPPLTPPPFSPVPPTQVRYRFRHHARGEHTVETSFRMVPTRLLAVTRVNGPTFSTELERH